MIGIRRPFIQALTALSLFLPLFLSFSSYLQPCTPSYNQWTTGISSSGSTQMIGGWPLMNQFIVIHDIENSKAGFAVGSSCSISPLNAAVEMYNSTGTTGSSGGGSSTDSTGVNTDPSLDPDGLGAAPNLAPAAAVVGAATIAAAVALLI